MINLHKKEDCCGCSACKQICPRNCIELKEDREGFLYPEVDNEHCINCSLCEKVCPMLAYSVEKLPDYVYAVKHKNLEIRQRSSSGGVFSILAEQVINQGGIVFGAKFNEYWELAHDYVESAEEIELLRRSKYVQSNINNMFCEAESFLKQGRKVMFVGTPCQVAGLKKYLRTEYKNLLTVDFVCHGVPSPKVWRMYLNWIRPNKNENRKQFHEINFRDKSTGWRNYNFVYATKETRNAHSYIANPYMQAFLANLTIRPSCYKCSFKKGRSNSDITIGDFWGIEQLVSNFDDNKGISLVMVYNSKIINCLNDSELIEMSYTNAVNSNYCIENSVSRPLCRDIYFFAMDKLNRFVLPFHNNFIINIIEKINRKVRSIQSIRS